MAQVHGDEDPQYCSRLKSYGVKVIKAFQVGPGFDLNILKTYKVDAFLFDAHSDQAYGGTGRTFDWSVLKEFKSQNIPFLVSGGLNPQNVIELVNNLKPYAVDAASGVESSPGIKDHRLLKDFIDIVHYISGPAVKES